MYKVNFTWFSPVLILLLLFSGCNEDEIIIPEDPYSAFSVSQDRLNFKNTETTKSFYIKNDGNVPLAWSLAINENFLNAIPSSGEINVSDSVEVNVEVSKDNLGMDRYEAHIQISSDSLPFHLIAVSMVNFTETKWLLQDEIADAEYDKKNDLIIAVTAKTNKLIVIDPERESMKELDLKIPASCVSVSSDGFYAAVGHMGAISYVNLQEMKVEKVIGLTFDVFDVVLTARKWLYAFPGEGQHVHIYAMDLNTDRVFNSWGTIYDKTIGKLHPSGKYIYGATTRISPSDFEKYDISMGGNAKILYDSPYHGDYEFGGNIWISEEGDFLFAKSRNIFTSTEEAATDLKYVKALQGEGQVLCLDHSAKARKTFAVFSNGSYGNTSNSGIRKYDQDFNLTGTVPLPKFLSEGKNGIQYVSESEALFGFFNAEGNKFYVLVKPQVFQHQTPPSSLKSALVTIVVD